MADSVKRMVYAEEAGFQKRVAYYYWLRASQVLALETPEALDLTMAKAVYADKVSKKDMCLTVITNTSIGGTIDAGNTPSESDLEWAVVTDDQFGKLALAYDSAGII